MRILVIVEQAQGQLKSGGLCAISAAGGLGFEVDVLLLSGPSTAEAAARQASLTEGVATVLLCQAEQFENLVAEDLVDVVSALVKERYTHLVADATALGRSLLPRIAADLDVGMQSDVVGIESPDVFLRPIYAGNAIAKVQILDPLKLITTRASAFAPAPERTTPCPTLLIERAPKVAGTRFVAAHITQSDRPDLANARVVVSGGRGLQSKENFRLVERVADKLGGAVGASRAAVDSGFAANDLQVGQTGKIVAPDLYIAAGISGAIQHLAGMSGSRIIVAINQDPEAPISQVADYMLVADLFEALPALEEAL